MMNRKRLREMGVPEDMTADDVKALFSLPDDDDRMHQMTTELNPAHELIADLDRRIGEEETKVREKIDRIRHYAGPDADDEIREAWGRFNMSVEPMRRQRDYVIKQLATIEAMKAPGPIIIMNPPERS